MPTRIRTAAAASAGLGALIAAALAPSAASADSRSTLPGSQPPWATAGALQGPASTSDYVNIRVYLGWRGGSAAAQRVADAVSTPGSAQEGQFLTPAQFAAQFAPTSTDVSAVESFLKGNGFSVVDVPGNHHYVAAEGTVAQAQAAFGTTLGVYSARGQQLRAPESAVSVPSGLAGIVTSVVGLDDSPLLSVANHTDGSGGTPSTGFRAGRPCSLWYGEKTVATPNAPAYGTSSKPLAVCGYTPAQVRGLYGLDRVAETGAGQSVAFIGANASPTIEQDLTTYSALHGLPAPSITQVVAPGTYRHPVNKKNNPPDFYGEETLDAEAIHTTAPGAHLVYVSSSNAQQDFDAAINHVIERHLAPVLSISYGFTGEDVPQGFVNALNDTFTEAVATGVGVFVSSGDGGDEASSLGHPAVDFYADLPNVTAVGGTSAAVAPTGTAPSGLDYAAVDTPTSALNQPGWKRSFEVGWQTGRDKLSATLTDRLSSAPYELDGTLARPLPGTFFGGGGGGTSVVFAEPGYQAAAIGQRSGRTVPDVSALGDPNTGLLVGQTQAFSNGTYYDEYRIGGTSVSAPLTAGLAAVANQRAGRPLGFLNPRLYQAYTADTGAYYDVDQADLFGTTLDDPLPSEVRVNYVNSQDASSGLAASLRTQEEPNQTLHSVAGYDTATGVGSPNAAQFLDAVTK